MFVSSKGTAMVYRKTYELYTFMVLFFDIILALKYSFRLFDERN